MGMSLKPMGAAAFVALVAGSAEAQSTADCYGNGYHMNCQIQEAPSLAVAPAPPDNPSSVAADNMAGALVMGAAVVGVVGLVAGAVQAQKEAEQRHQAQLESEKALQPPPGYNPSCTADQIRAGAC
jgi:hypothetical protein